MSKALTNAPQDMPSLRVTDALDTLAGFSVFSPLGDGISRGTMTEMVLVAGMACFGSSGKRATDEQNAFAKSLKPRALIASLRSKNTTKSDNTVSALSNRDMAHDFILANSENIVLAANSIGTHSDKLTNASAPHGVLMSDPKAIERSRPRRGVCAGTFQARVGFSASGHAGLSAAMRFLSWSVMVDGQRMSMIESTAHWHAETIDSLGQDIHDLMLETLQAFLQGRKSVSRLSPTSSHRQLVWPLASCEGKDADYVSLSPVVSFSMLGEIEKRLRDMAYGEDKRFMRSREVTVGGAKPQNIGLIAMDASGAFKRLLNEPMPPLSRSLAWSIRKDCIRVSHHLISKEALAAFKSAANREICQLNAEHASVTDRAIARMVKECATQVIDAHEQSGCGVTLGDKASALVAALVSRRGEDFENLVMQCVEAVITKAGKLQLGPAKETLMGTDGQVARLAAVARQSLGEACDE